MAAQTKAKELKSDLVDSEHLLFALTTDSEIYNLLVESKIQPQLITDELAKIYKRGTVDRVVQFSPRIKKILNDALSPKFVFLRSDPSECSLHIKNKEAL